MKQSKELVAGLNRADIRGKVTEKSWPEHVEVCRSDYRSQNGHIRSRSNSSSSYSYK